MRFAILTVPLLLIFGVLTFFGDRATALKAHSFRRASTVSPEDADSDTDLASLLKGQPAEPDGILSSAIELLNSMKSSPSCNRIAATKLLTSCQSIDGIGNERGSDPAGSLDYVKSLYAARLAVCEITGAGASIPEQCSSILIPQATDTSLQRGDKPKAGREGIHEAQLERCLNSLESRPQWWTSYSNSRQNAVVMCQAARLEIEKDEVLKLHKKLTGITFGLTNTLNKSLHNTEMEAVRHKEFVEEVDSIRLRLMRDLEDVDLNARSRFSNLFNNIEARLRDVTVGAMTAIAKVESDTTSLKKNIQISTSSMNDLKQGIGEVFVDIMERNTELAAAENKSFQANQELALTLQHSLDLINSQDMGHLFQGFGSLHTALASNMNQFLELPTDKLKESLNNVIASMNHRQVSLDKRMQWLDQSFQQFELRTEALHAVQMRGIETNLHQQESFQTDLRIAQTLLNEILISTANLRSSIEETSTLFKRAASFGGMLNTASRLLWSIPLLGVLGLFNSRIAVVIFIFCVSVIGLLSTGICDWLNVIGSTLRANYLSGSRHGIILFTFGAFSVTVVIAALVRRGALLQSENFPIGHFKTRGRSRACAGDLP